MLAARFVLVVARHFHIVAAAKGSPIDGAEHPGKSVWQSRERGRSLETPFIESAVVALAHEHSFDAPINAELLRRATS